ncbi:MAG TPA: CSLREA domain-containing protein [Rudaea sp.]|nr:CSLREA domain-containing protein [Rudaea sp.]
MTRLSIWLALAALCVSSHALAVTITVTSTDDTIDNADGKTTLREAIAAFNASAVSNPGDTIAFDIPGAGVHTIALTANLPNVNKPVFINGYSQPGSSANTNALNAGINAVVLIEIAAPPGGVGLQVLANGTTIRGLAIHGYRAIMVGASDVVVAGNFIGTDAAGTTALPGLSGAYGVQVFSYLSPSNNVIIGGPNDADRNLIVPAGNGIDSYGNGVQLPYNPPGPGTGYVIQGNYIGTDITGTLALSGGQGLDAVSNALVYGNLISGNPGGAVRLIDNDTLQGNLIGTQRDGASALPNGNFGGIQIQGGNSTIGYGSEAAPNVIAHNTGYGIVVYNGSTQGSSNINTRNQIAFNSIYANARLGISLNYSPLVLDNDAGDLDAWALPNLIGNDGQNYPVIASATANGGGVIVAGTLNSNANRAFALQFFANATCDASGYGQGQTFIGSTTVTTDASGNASFGPLGFNVPPGQAVITSTAEDLSAAANGNTSEFSQCVSIEVGDTIFINGFD